MSHKANNEQRQALAARIKQLAVNVGYKTANLIILANAKIGNVPFFCPIGDDLIHAHLDSYAPKWRALWAEFQEKQGNEKSAIHEQAIPVLQTLRELITTTFNISFINNAELTDFLATVKSALMIRSTGDEDTEEAANPGGNESVSAVAPTIPAVSAAIGKVVASYFSEKSLKQRLLSPKNDITKTAFMPVLLQQMIGEPMGGFKLSPEVIRSGVMYTRLEHTRIQVAPGHGELVVNNKGLFDTFSITQSQTTYATIARKTWRLVPTKAGLQMTKNPKLLQDRPSISSAIVQRLAGLGRQIEQYYGMPMDVEFIYNPNDDVISIVQARPIPKDVVCTITPSSVPPQSSLL